MSLSSGKGFMNIFVEGLRHLNRRGQWEASAFVGLDSIAEVIDDELEIGCVLSIE